MCGLNECDVWRKTEIWVRLLISVQKTYDFKIELYRLNWEVYGWTITGHSPEKSVNLFFLLSYIVVTKARWSVLSSVSSFFSLQLLYIGRYWCQHPDKNLLFITCPTLSKIVLQNFLLNIFIVNTFFFSLIKSVKKDRKNFRCLI